MTIRSIVLDPLRRRRRQSVIASYDLDGDYASWADALAASSGYDSEVVLDATRSALLRVKSGEAEYERDSVIFDEIEYSWAPLAALLLAAARNGGKLDLIDFGGSLGSTFFQNRRFLARLQSVRWSIVEQRRHVEVGRQWFEDERLRFYSSIAECTATNSPTTGLLSGVLHYVDKPYDILAELFDANLEMVVIDRTPFADIPVDRICVQTVPPAIYDASYPSWIFSRSGFEERIPKQWEILARFDSLDRLTAPVDVKYSGLVLVRRDITEATQ